MVWASSRTGSWTTSLARPDDPQPLTWSRPGAPFDIIRVAHVELLVTDLDRSREFYEGQIGFVVTEEAGGALYLRGYEDRHHHCLVLRKGERPAVSHIAFLVGSEDDLEQAFHYYESRGCAPGWLDAGVEAGQGRALRVIDQLGFPVEYYSEMEPAERLLQRYDLQRGARLRRIDHFNLHVPDVQAAFDHYFGELGFRCSEYIEGDSPDRTLYAAWLFRKPSTHDLALTGGAGPRLHHTAFWLGDVTGIVQLCDALGGSGWHRSIERGPGRHGVSNAFYLYLRDPDGHRIELFTDDYWTGDPDLKPVRWSVHEERRRSFWGHQVAESWYLESSEVVDLEGQPIPLVQPANQEMTAAVLPR